MSRIKKDAPAEMVSAWGDHPVEDLADNLLDVIAGDRTYSMMSWAQVDQALDLVSHHVKLGQVDGVPTKVWP
jgi:hypothetical protein